MTNSVRNYFPITYGDPLCFLKSEQKTKLATSNIEKIFRRALTVGYIPVDIAFNITLIPIRLVQEVILKIVNLYQNSEYFIRKNFYISGNVSSIEKADIVCLSEMNSVEHHRKINGFVINHYSKLNDVVLLEGKFKFMLKLPFVKGQAKYARFGTILKGWDCLSYYDKVKMFGATLGLFGIGIDFINRHHKYNLESAELFLVRNAWRMIYLPFLHLYNSVFGTVFYKRNKNMCKTIESNLSVRRKIFVIGGAAHFPAFHILSPISSILRINPFLISTRRFLEGKKYVVLTPKKYSMTLFSD